MKIYLVVSQQLKKNKYNKFTHFGKQTQLKMHKIILLIYFYLANHIATNNKNWYTREVQFTKHKM